MWTTIQNIATPIGLIAFIVAIAATAYRRRLTYLHKLIDSAPTDQRPRLIEGLFETYTIKDDNLLPGQKFKLLQKVLSIRERRFRLVAIVAIIISAIIAGLIATIALVNKAPRFQARVLRSPYDVLYQGYEKLAAGALSEADSLFAKAHALNPSLPDPFYWQAIVAKASGNRDLSMSYIEQSLKRDQQFVHSIVLKIKLLLTSGSEKAIDAERQCLSLMETHADNVELAVWLSCLRQNKLFARNAITDTEIDGLCQPPQYKWQYSYE